MIVPRSDLEAGDAALERDRAGLPVLDRGQRRDIGDALELGRALRRCDVAFPAEIAGGEIEREQLAAGGSDEQAAAA